MKHLLFSLIFILGFQVMTCFAEPPQENSVEVQFDDGQVPEYPSYSLKLSYLEMNSDKEPVILLIHGNSTSKEVFSSFMQRSEFQQFRVIAVDLPGHGLSSDFPTPIKDFFKAHEDLIWKFSKQYYTFPGYAHALVKFLETLKINPKKVRIFGWSMGGHIAIDMISEMPAIQKAVMSGSPINTYDKMAESFEALKAVHLGPPFAGKTIFDLIGYRDAMTLEQAGTFLTLVGVPPSKIAIDATMRTDPEARYFMAQFASSAGKYLQLDSVHSADYADQETTVRKYASQFVLLQGGHDMVSVHGEERARIETEVGVPVFEIEEAGHAVFIDAPEKTAKILQESF